jgi:ferritin-like metal-binding protein YciE
MRSAALNVIGITRLSSMSGKRMEAWTTVSIRDPSDTYALGIANKAVDCEFTPMGLPNFARLGSGESWLQPIDPRSDTVSPITTTSARIRHARRRFNARKVGNMDNLCAPRLNDLDQVDRIERALARAILIISRQQWMAYNKSTPFGKAALRTPMIRCVPIFRQMHTSLAQQRQKRNPELRVSAFLRHWHARCEQQQSSKFVAAATASEIVDALQPLPSDITNPCKTKFGVTLLIQENAMKLKSLQDLYVSELKDLYSAENQLLKALPKMAKAASAPELKKAFATHLEETRGQVERLETIFEELEASPKGKKCKAMEGLVEEGSEMIEEDAEPAVKDAGLIAAAQKVEHYEMAGYGTVRTFAELLGYDKAAKLLQETLDEEAATDEKLTELANSVINVEAESVES